MQSYHLNLYPAKVPKLIAELVNWWIGELANWQIGKLPKAPSELCEPRGQIAEGPE
jgi:hypothetical protein